MGLLIISALFLKRRINYHWQGIVNALFKLIENLSMVSRVVLVIQRERMEESTSSWAQESTHTTM
jgi:hypothetical protein